MRLYDIVNVEVDDNTAKLLGYAKLFKLGRDLKIAEAGRIGNFKQLVAYSGPLGNVLKGIRSPYVLGVEAKPDARIEEKVLSELGENGKLLALDLGYLTIVPREKLPSALNASSWLIKRAKHAKVGIAVATFASSAENLLSSMQVVCILMLLGLKQDEAKRALGVWGDVL
ncbi:MAG: hypothetical protein ACP5T4_00130 [Candidatus Micrarchaeia archaeon]